MQTRVVRGVATSIRTEAGMTHVRYHKTDVVSFNDDTITLRSGGWRTVTTKTRMNQAAHQFELGYSVWQRKGEWYVATPDGRTLEFYNGMTFDR